MWWRGTSDLPKAREFRVQGFRGSTNDRREQEEGLQKWGCWHKISN